MHNSRLRPRLLTLIIAITATSFVGTAANAYCDPPRKGARDAVPEKSGRQEVFSIVGLIDFDGDGNSDRKLLHELVAASGATLDNEVDDDGVRRPANGKITSKTTMLVFGEFIDPATVTDPKKREVAKRMVRHFHAMRAEARKAGVRSIALLNFTTFSRKLSHRKRHPWLYGDPPSTPTGRTSRFYSRSRRLKQPKPSSQPSKVFRGDKSGDDR
jgi:hypothetical protein